MPTCPCLFCCADQCCLLVTNPHHHGTSTCLQLVPQAKQPRACSCPCHNGSSLHSELLPEQPLAWLCSHVAKRLWATDPVPTAHPLAPGLVPWRQIDGIRFHCDCCGCAPAAVAALRAAAVAAPPAAGRCITSSSGRHRLTCPSLTPGGQKVGYALQGPRLAPLAQSPAPGLAG